ncbi:MAG TPA: NAD-binding protein, partial [Chloroflexota bacterium]|nr:NAD-binding protein [Chloroflexota bacterium]
GARNATLCYMVGGDEQLLERCRPVFAASGKHIFHMGELGTGAAAKLAQQIVTTVNMLAAFEGMSVAEAAGLKLDSFDQLLRVSAGQSYMADRWLERRKQLGPDGGEGFYKGLIPALKLGHELGVSLPGTSLFQQLVNRMLG